MLREKNGQAENAAGDQRRLGARQGKEATKGGGKSQNCQISLWTVLTDVRNFRHYGILPAHGWTYLWDEIEDALQLARRREEEIVQKSAELRALSSRFQQVVGDDT